MYETFIPHNFIITIQSALGKPLRNWFAEIFFAATTACGTVLSWILKSNNDKCFRKIYHFVQRLGNEDEKIQNAYLTWIVAALKGFMQTATSIRFTLDDTPLKRRGPKIEGAGYMHDPINANNKNAICYGHSFVATSLAVDHPKWGTLRLPLRWRFYVRQDDLEQIDESIRPKFQTKLQIGIDLISRVVATVRKATNKRIQLTFDSGYVSNELFEVMNALQVDVVTRFKKNANFYQLPTEPATAKRGRPRKYGDVFKLKDWLEKRDEETFRENVKLYGGVKCVEFKTTLATSRITNGRSVRLVTSRFVKGDKAGDWTVFVSTNLTATPQEILIEYSRRFSIEETSKDLKDVCGLGRQEARKWESCKACATITALNFTAVEIWAWERDASESIASRSPWDDPNRRPSHRNKRDLVARKIGLEIFSRNIVGAKNDDIQEKILRLARFLGLAV